LDGYNELALADITTACANIRKPGGMVVDEDGDLVPNRGQQVSVLLEKRLKQFWFFTRYAYMTQREPDWATGEGVPELAELSNLDSYLKSFPLAKDVEKPPQFPGQDKARKWFEQFDTWAAKTLGPSGVPLLYVLRKESEIQDEDPGWYEPNLKMDVALRGPHGDDNIFWREDNTAVWDMLVHCLHPTKEYAYAQPFERAMNGNGAYTALKERMLGATITKALEAKADHLIRTLQFNGQTKGLSFDKFITTFTQAFLDCGMEYPEDKKVSLLLRAITDTSLQIACGQIRGSRDLKKDFTAAVSYIVEELASRADTHSRGARNVSSTNRGSRGGRGGRSGRNDRNHRGGRGRGRGGRSGRGGRGSHSRGGEGPLNKWDASKPGAWYSYKAYVNFTPEQKRLNKEAKEKAGIPTTNRTSNIAALTQRIEELATNIEVAQAVNQHQSQSIGATISGKRKRQSEE
jgi:hypothetical protein